MLAARQDILTIHYGDPGDILVGGLGVPNVLIDMDSPVLHVN